MIECITFKSFEGNQKYLLMYEACNFFNQYFCSEIYDQDQILKKVTFITW